VCDRLTRQVATLLATSSFALVDGDVPDVATDWEVPGGALLRVGRCRERETAAAAFGSGTRGSSGGYRLTVILKTTRMPLW
jgi:hypothetical protein